MKNYLTSFSLFVLIGIVASCKTDPPPSGNTFGAGVSKTEPTMTFADVVKHLEAGDTVNVVLKAKVTKVCQEKGCWMNLVDPAAESDQSLFVKFKDYGFFVPKDISGREVLVEGMAYNEITSVKQLKHYAKDDGKSEAEIDAITEPAMQKKFMASGVVLLPPTAQ
jgi:hypothetical protein